ncbi:hypothetical protein EVAR_12915_1 [Eumeta japonica]|uniref:Uncharacterized protein n=1 Tax=Eumeta variegata TaxID=151549 RepID=A0A4C1TW72_EUMVA|nr:hypothetical protein EVAR_12915_1 [Eumeta japonica]
MQINKAMFDPEGFGEIPWSDFVQTLQHPDFVAQVPPHKREILLDKACNATTNAITFQEFVNVVSTKILKRLCPYKSRIDYRPGVVTCTHSGAADLAAPSTRAEHPRAVMANLSYAKATASPRKDPPKNVSNYTSTEDIKVLLSVTTSTDIGELALLAKKFKAAANPAGKIIVLVEHSRLCKR